MNATAFIIGPQDGPGAALMDMAHMQGFAAVLPYTGVMAAEGQTQRTPLCFFLFASVPRIEALRPVAGAIRFCPNRRLRFSPMLYFAESPSVEIISACLNLGFDDIVAMPFTPKRVSDRLDRQVGQSLIYYETAGYFGPDRRGRLAEPQRSDENRVGGPFRRLEIMRHFGSGISILRDDLHGRTQMPQSG